MLRGHGGEIFLLAQSLGLRPEEIQDHSSNLSPLPPPPGLYTFLKEHLWEIELLPEVDSLSLRKALEEKYGHPAAHFLPSSGTTEWIFALPRAGSFRQALILGPTYSDYADALKLAGVPFRYFLMREEEGFRVDGASFCKALQGVDLVFLCNPNNPTGIYLPLASLREALERFPETIFVCDESYLDFHPQGLSALSFKPFPDNLVVLRSFSKVYRVPGLRLGFCAAGKFLLEALWKMYLPWSVNRLAQLAGPWLLEQEAYVDKVRRFVQEERGYFLPLLKALPGVEVFPGEIHFFLLKLKFHQAGKVWETLLKEHKILVRNAANFFGLGANFLRLALRGREENKRLLKALEEVLS